MNTPKRSPQTPQQFRDKWQIGRTKYHELVNSGVLRQTYQVSTGMAIKDYRASNWFRSNLMALNAQIVSGDVQAE